MLQNQRQTKNLYRIGSNQNLYRIILEVFTKKIQHMFTWYFLMWGYWFCSTDEFALSDIFLWKVLDFVESNILVWRAEVDLVMIFFVPDLGALYWIEGSNNHLIARGILLIWLTLVVWVCSCNGTASTINHRSHVFESGRNIDLFKDPLFAL